MKMDAAGTALTQEQYDIFTKNPNSPAAQAMKLIPPTVKFDALKAEREATGGRGYLWGAPAGTPQEGDMVTTALLSGVTQGQKFETLGDRKLPDVYIPITVGTNTTPGLYARKLSNAEKAALYGV